jgi:hypothetical protein
VAILHTDLPDQAGERALVQQLAALPDNQLHIWCGIGYLPLVRDIDLILWHEQAGVFCVEVKAVPLGMIESFSYESCIIRGRGKKATPTFQAHKAMMGLHQFLKPRLRPPPFIIATSCWPLISRVEWDQNWGGDIDICGDYSRGLIFSEDLTSGHKGLSDRLRSIWSRPPVRDSSDRPFVHSQGDLAKFASALDHTAVPKLAPSDYDRLRQIEKQVRSSTQAQVPVDAGLNAVYTGKPGTGKTFRLLDIAIRNTLAGRSSLFACYNKVLASDWRRVLSSSEPLKRATGTLEVMDVFELLSTYLKQIDRDLESSDVEEFGDMAAEMIIEHRDVLPLYDAIVVDEAQDMRDSHLRVLQALGQTGATFCVASGEGQELYGEKSEWLKQFELQASTFALRRNFRNTRPVYQFAQLYYEGQLDHKRLVRANSRFKDTKANLQLEFQRGEGIAPEIVFVDDSELSNEDPSDPFYGQTQREIMALEFQRIVENQLEILKARPRDRPQDLLLLVPGPSSTEYTWLKDALENVSVGVTDYVRTANRRDLAPSDKVRVSTYHSARGIEGSRVVVFGMEHILSSAGSSEKAQNLAYIALSRALFELVIVLRSGNVEAEVPAFLLKVRSLMTGEELAPLVKAIPRSEDSWILADPAEILSGMRVEHPEFGRGVVKWASTEDAVVLFSKIGEKLLRLEYARLRIV